MLAVLYKRYMSSRDLASSVSWEADRVEVELIVVPQSTAAAVAV